MVKEGKISIRLTAPLKLALEARAVKDDEFPAEIVRRALAAFLSPRKAK